MPTKGKPNKGRPNGSGNGNGNGTGEHHDECECKIGPQSCRELVQQEVMAVLQKMAAVKEGLSSGALKVRLHRVEK